MEKVFLYKSLSIDFIVPATHFEYVLVGISNKR